MQSELTGIKHLQIKLSEEEYNKLDDLARSERVKITPFARNLLVAALDRNEGDEEKPPVMSRRWGKVLDFILAHGTKEEREWISGNLRTFASAIKARMNPKDQ